MDILEIKFLRDVFGIRFNDGKLRPVTGDFYDFFNQLVMAYLSYVWPSIVNTGSMIGILLIGHVYSSLSFYNKVCMMVNLYFMVTKNKDISNKFNEKL